MYLKRLIALLTSFITILLFQNCGPTTVQTTEDLLSGRDLASVDDTVPPGSSGSDIELPTPPRPPTDGETPQTPGTTNFSLVIAKAGNGVVTSTPSGIQCGAQCKMSFSKDSSVTLMAQPNSDAVFKGWSGDCTGSGLTCTVKMSALKNVSVNFEPLLPEMSIDAVISAMPRNSWKSLPSTQMKDVCPPPYAAYNCAAVISAWSGGAYDEKRDRMVIIGGGHDDSWYNNVFSFDLNSMQWQRLSEMPENTGKQAPAHWRDIRVETCGYYPKGPLNIPADFMKGSYVDIEKCGLEPLVSQLDFQQPRSTHTYQRVFVEPTQDLYCYISLGTFPSAQTGTNVTPCLNPKTGVWTEIAKRPINVGGRGQTALDSKGQVWSVTASSGPLGMYSPVTNSWKTFGFLNSNAGGTTDVDRKRDHLYVLYPLDTGSYSLRKFDIGNSTSLNTKPYYSEVTVKGEAPQNLGTRPGFVYRDDEDQMYAWGGGKTIYLFNPTTQTWSKKEALGDDPGVQANWGTYGRFRYSPKRGVFVLVNSTTQNVFIYKP